MRKPTKKEYGQTAVVGLLGGYLIGGVIGSIATITGVICGLVWIAVSIQRRTIVL